MPSSGTRVHLEQVSKRLQPLSSKFHAADAKSLRARDGGCGKLRASARRIFRFVFVYLLRLILKNSLRAA